MNERTIPDASALTGWRKSTYSGNEGGSCVEVVDGYPLGVPVRDSKVSCGPALVFNPIAWSSLVSSLKSGNFSA
ncbi:DUF397 domain-containing protein [Streptomyces sp. NPDC048389]|uniref:DUF397 domain-containing protein n=1 Tax=Streptomyces sp. NPDC048389 TaxID=3154622 RepID=UPI0034565BDA